MSTGFGGSMPEHYARLLEPILFDGFAVDLSQRLVLKGGGTVLDVACGSGVVARKVQSQYQSSTVIATDYSLAMVKQARQTPRDYAVAANGIRLPFQDHQFDAVVCQFGLMFIPEPLAALSEARRVLAPGGHVLFSVWDRLESNPVWLALEQALQEVFPEEPRPFMPTPFLLADQQLLRDLAIQAGLQDVTVHIATVRTPLTATENLVDGFLLGTPLGSYLAGLPDASEHSKRLAPKVAEKLGDPFQANLQALVVQGTRA